MSSGSRLPQWSESAVRPRTRRLARALTLALILAGGAALRLYGLNWDDGHWLHPDERQIYLIVLDLSWPDSLAEALSPASPLNPGFFAYGSLPIYFLKLAATGVRALYPALDLEDDLHLVARPLIALVDVGTIYLTYRLARVLWASPRRRLEESEGPAEDAAGGTAVGLLAAAFVSLAVLHVQLAHFYTVDPLLTFFVMLTLNLAADVAQRGVHRRRIALGAALGLSLATKVTAAPLILVVLAACYLHPLRSSPQSPAPNRQSLLLHALRCMILPLAVASAVFFLTQPYALIDWPTFVDHTLREGQIARGEIDVPYTVQYAGTPPFVYSVWQTALWGLAPPLGLCAWAGLALSLIRWLRRGLWADVLLLSWAGPYLVITSLLYSKYLRYMLPLVPILCLLAAGLLRASAWHRAPDKHPIVTLKHLPSFASRLSFVVALLVLLSSLTYTLVFCSLYSVPHSWVTASEWIYRNVPVGSNLAVEHWDMALPLTVEEDGVRQSPTEYTYRTLFLYDEPDDAAKWEALTADLSASEYLVIASRRLYGSIPRLPERYPVATPYYDLLFGGGLGFELVGEFTRRPAWLNPRLPPLTDAAPAILRPDESFVVYDHPRALVFRNVERLPAGELLRRLGFSSSPAGW